MGLFRWIADNNTSIKDNSYEVFALAAHTSYYKILAGTHPGTLLLKVRNALSTYEFPMIKPTDHDHHSFTHYRMLENLQKNGWFDRFLTFDEYNLLRPVHRERIRFSSDLYTAFRDFSVFKTAIMDHAMANEMVSLRLLHEDKTLANHIIAEKAEKKKHKSFERWRRLDAARQDADAEQQFNSRTLMLQQREESEINHPPPAYSPSPSPPPVHRISVHSRSVSLPSPAAPLPRRADRSSIISRISPTITGPPPPHRLPTPPRIPGRLLRPGHKLEPVSDCSDPLAFPYDEYGRELKNRRLAQWKEEQRLNAELQHLEEYASAVNTGRNARGRPNPVNLNLLPPGSPGCPNL